MSVHAELDAIAVQLRSGEERRETPRTIVSWHGAKKRGYWIVSVIRAEMTKAGLYTDPDFESAFIDEPVAFRIMEPTLGNIEIAAAPMLSSGTGTVGSEAAVSTAFVDPVPRLRMLAAANRIPVSVKPDTSVNEAITIMLARDYSQLPVLQNERSVKGMISWRSFGQKAGLGYSPVRCADIAEPATVLPADTPLLQAVAIIAEREVILVSNSTSDSQIRGLVTTSDLAVQFKFLAEPFMLLGEIENQIRVLLDGKFSATELQAVRAEGDADRAVQELSDLTFGEYVRLLQLPDNWSKLGLTLERRVIIDLLDRVRIIRNDVMHFDPDGLEDTDLDTLRDAVKLFQTVSSIRMSGKKSET